jgi:glycosyltransferase involved in cell wall biosynthesis
LRQKQTGAADDDGYLMRVLMISKACLVGSYQTKLEAIARLPDVELTVIVPPSWDDPDGRVTLERRFTAGYELLVDPIRFNGQYHYYYFPTLPERLRRVRPDVVHIDEEPYNLATWLAMRQARAAGARTLFFTWQNIARRYPPPFSLMERQVLAGVDYAIMGNREAATVWRAKGYRGPLRVIPQFGVDPALFSPPPARDPGRAFIIGSANRRLVPEKGIDLLLRAAAGLPGLWQLHIAGDGPALAALRQLAAQLGIAARVHFDGPIPSDQVPGYLRHLDALVLTPRTLPNWKEQFGRVLVEAMACGVPVLGSCSGEIPHVIGEAGLIVPEEDVDAIRNGLLQLMQNDALRIELGRRGRERVLEQFTQAQIAAQTVEVYRSMLDGAVARNGRGE